MHSLPLLPNLLRSAFLPLAVAAFVLVAGGRATAGCGDHAVILKAADGSVPAQSAPKPPCHGPNCSAKPPDHQAPPISTTVIQVVSAKEVLTALELSAPSGGQPKRRAFEFLSPVPIHRASAIFHPPRA